MIDDAGAIGRRAVLRGGVLAGAGLALPAAAAPARFVADPRVDALFVARFPQAAGIEADGRGVRLANDAITPEAFGAIGDGTADDQRAIQSAVSFAEAVGAPRVVFGHRRYALWTPRRTSPVTHNNRHDGHALIVSAQLTLQGAPGGTTLFYRSPDGRELQQHWQVVGGQVWRGAGIFLRGLGFVPRDRSVLPGVTLIDMILDGGCDKGAWFGYPARPSDGDGWDLTQKGLWSENDRPTGDWRLVNSEVRRFRGELFYQGGQHHGAFVGRNIRMGQTNADILNPCGTNIDIDGGTFFDGNSGWEGWGGHAGRLVNCRFVRCRSMGGIQGGSGNFGRPGGYNVPTRFEPGVDPWLTLDIVAEDCGQVAVGSWVRGRVRLIDSFLYLSGQIYPMLRSVRLEVSGLATGKVAVDSVVSIHARREQGSRAISDIDLRVTADATPAAKARGRTYRRAADWGGSLGDGITIRVGRAVIRQASGASYPALDAVPRVVSG